jgi:Phage integrase family
MFLLFSKIKHLGADKATENLQNWAGLHKVRHRKFGAQTSIVTLLISGPALLEDGRLIFDDATLRRLLGSIESNRLMLLCGAGLSMPPPSNLMSAVRVAYSLEEEVQMLGILPEPAATAVAVAAFTGTRKGEIRGLLWEDYDGFSIRVKQAVWRSHVDEPKREKSKGAIPVIAQLTLFLERHRARSGNPRQGYILQSPHGKPLNLDALARDVIRPAFEAAKLPWYGWHAFRRGLATNLNRLAVSDKVIQQILRHANVTTTMNIYVKMVSRDAKVAMKTLEANCAATVQQKKIIGAAEGSKTPMNGKQEISVSEQFTKVLAEREGFESSR